MRLVLLAAVAVALLQGAENWTRLTTPHFELLTTAGEKKGREAILYFEEVRSFFQEASSSGAANQSKTPVRIIAFQSEKEFKPYRPNETAAAFYVGAPDRDYIVMGNISSENYPVAIHEYTHLLVEHSGVKLPVWLNEGLADVYSSLKPVGKKIQVGALLPGRMAELQNGRWLDLHTLTVVDTGSPYYNEKNRAGAFYAESWALVHMLALSPDYRPKFSAFLKAIANATQPEQVFQVTYGKSLEEIQKDLRQYVQGNKFYGIVFNTKLQKSEEDPDVEALAPVEARLALAEMEASTERQQHAKDLYDQLAKDLPNDWRVEAALARFAWRGENLKEALRHYARAAELGSTSSKLYFEYATLDRTKAVPMLRKALELDPNYADARFQLSYALLSAREFQAALDEMAKVKKVTPEQAPSFFLAMAHAQLQTGKREEAGKSAEKSKLYAKTPEAKASAEELIQYLNSVAQAEREREAAKAAMPEPQLQLRRQPVADMAVKEEPSEPVPMQKRLLRRDATTRLEGVIKQVDCLGKKARLVIRVAGKPVSFLIDDPTGISIKGSDAGTIEFACGAQKERRVAVEYVPRADAVHKTSGDVRVIEFLAAN